MAAMAPALTDAPPEAHRIRFKLAPPSTLSPNPVQPGVTPSNGAVVKRSRAAATQPPSPEHHPHTTPVGNGNSNSSGGGSSVAVPSCKREEPSSQPEAPPHALGRLQPLVASYLCSDVTAVPSSKEYFLPRQRPSLELELSEERLRSLMSGTGAPPFNGVAKRLTRPAPGMERDGLLATGNPAALNGGSNGTRTPAGSGSGSDSPPPPLESASRGGLHGNGPFRSGGGGGADPQHAADVSQDNSNPEQPPPPPSSSSTPSQDPTENNNSCSSSTDRPPSLAATDSSLPPSCSLEPPISSPAHNHPAPTLGSLGTELRVRTQQSTSRQGQIDGRLRRLRKRLQVVQAKQVERHLQQQLGGLLQSTLVPLEALRKKEGPTASTSISAAATTTTTTSVTALTPQEREGLSRFLKGGSVPAELERLSLSGSTNLHAAEEAFDSDATESSSGGETDVEEDELGRVDVEQRHVPLWRRAEGRYAVDRASIISHWNWLQAHVSDLEYRIRQQTDIYRQIRSSKGPVGLGDPAPAEPSLEGLCEVKEEPVSCQVSQDFGSDVSESSVSDPGLRKACPSGKQVNGVINNLRTGSPETAHSEELRRQQQWAGVSSVVPSPADHTCVAARTRPLISCKRRRLVRPSTLTNLNRKVQRASVCRCSCEVNPQCVTCVGRSASPLEPSYDRLLLERLSQYDPSVHPILSFSDDVMMSLHMQRLLKSHWQSRPLEKIKPIKKLSLKHKLSLGSRPSNPASSSSCSKDKHKLSNSLLSTVRLSHHKMRGEKLHRQQFDSLLSASKLEGRHHRGDRGPSVSHGAYDKTHSRKRPREHSLERMENTPKLYTDVGSPCPSLLGLQTPTHSPLLRQISTSSETSTPLSLTGLSATSTPTPIRRRRGESSFDINNIVIPMSVAATTRVEKLQYKEILTPSWREVDVCAKPILPEDNTVEVEDLSDGAFGELHQPCQDQERSRWSWTASAIAKRRGSRSYRSSDGRTTPLLGGTHPSTPQPSSPDMAHFHLLEDSCGAPSPSSPPSPDMLLPHSHRLLSSDDTRCSTPDEEMVLQPVQPWDRRDFPLESDLPRETDESQESPAEEQPYRTMRRISGSKTRSESDTGPPSPLPDESSSSRHRTPACAPKTSHR
ncbi:KAT8 regulatory NSL complex subunit 1 isoform X1 [Clupea harengus]|uniref:KAT8 regulatory NSL complex subunit 1 isoform X1 n=1 Tax=Clupea harengus TaxID=7950 RepID=A0A6P3VIJ8_CLUHA|nr:KAT8 regulatory NSL complex subunit 1 isoform X1 [Clupea harengus]XP_012672317.2 KAT8 regulatory NSL complex subunit 1 isoform X1 [Clupea harengus]XP_031423171.1 KAT8 regulatory NSL complex subunit 1 isoform X1 [Clupea harengus]